MGAQSIDASGKRGARRRHCGGQPRAGRRGGATAARPRRGGDAEAHRRHPPTPPSPPDSHRNLLHTARRPRDARLHNLPCNSSSLSADSPTNASTRRSAMPVTPGSSSPFSPTRATRTPSSAMFLRCVTTPGTAACRAQAQIAPHQAGVGPRLAGNRR